MKRFLVLVALLALAGCASSTTPDEWRQYARGAYLQGVADGKAAVRCQPVVYQGAVTVAPVYVNACEQARVDGAAIGEASKQADYDLTNSKKERQRSLMRYIELGGKAAQ